MIKFIGYKYHDYVSKKTGNNVKGYSLYFTEEGVDNVAGLTCFDAFVSCEVYDKYVKNISLDSIVNLFYDRNGRVVGVVNNK